MRRRARGAAALLLMAGAMPAGAEEVPASDVARRGPLEIRDEWLLAQPRLTLPALSPDPLADGQTRLALDLAWGSDFGWQPSDPASRRTAYLVDGEHRTVTVDVRHGLTPSLTVGVRVPVHWRGGGVMDGLIDWFHDRTGLPDGARPAFPADRLRVEWAGETRRTQRWDADAGAGVGNLELIGHWAFRRRAEGWTAAVASRATLPTGTGAFGGNGPEAGAQLVTAHPLGGAFDLYAGGGATVHATGMLAGVEYAPVRGHGFMAFEWRPARWCSVTVELDASTRLVDNLPHYPSWQSYFRMGTAMDLAPGWRLEGGFVEGLKNQRATTDFGIVAGISRAFGR
jgi:uncharacterized protein DUF3187